jgi:hypothetical protein
MMIVRIFQQVMNLICSILLLAGCASTPFDYSGQETGVLCYMAIHDVDAVAKSLVAQRISGGVESDQCQELAVRYRQELLRKRAAKRKSAEKMAPGTSNDPYASETPALPEVRI